MLIKLIIISLCVTLGSNLIGVLESYLNTWIAQHITYDMRNEMYQHLQQMSHRFFTTNSQGDIITRMTSDIDGVKQIITNTFRSILSLFISPRQRPRRRQLRASGILLQRTFPKRFHLIQMPERIVEEDETVQSRIAHDGYLLGRSAHSVNALGPKRNPEIGHDFHAAGSGLLGVDHRLEQ